MDWCRVTFSRQCRSAGNISAGGNIETGFEGLIQAGLGGMFVRAAKYSMATVTFLLVQSTPVRVAPS